MNCLLCVATPDNGGQGWWVTLHNAPSMPNLALPYHPPHLFPHFLTRQPDSSSVRVQKSAKFREFFVCSPDRCLPSAAGRQKGPKVPMAGVKVSSAEPAFSSWPCHAVPRRHSADKPMDGQDDKNDSLEKEECAEEGESLEEVEDEFHPSEEERQGPLALTKEVETEEKLKQEQEEESIPIDEPTTEDKDIYENIKDEVEVPSVASQQEVQYEQRDLDGQVVEMGGDGSYELGHLGAQPSVASYVEYTLAEPRDEDSTMQVEYIGPADISGLPPDARIEYVTIPGELGSSQGMSPTKVIGVYSEPGSISHLSPTKVIGVYSDYHSPLLQHFQPDSSRLDPLQTAMAEAEKSDPMAIHLYVPQTSRSQVDYERDPHPPIHPPPPFDDPPLLTDPYFSSSKDRDSPMYTILENAPSGYPPSSVHPYSPSRTYSSIYGLSSPSPSSYPYQGHGYRGQDSYGRKPYESTYTMSSGGSVSSSVAGDIWSSTTPFPHYENYTSHQGLGHHTQQLLPDSSSEMLTNPLLGKYNHYEPRNTYQSPPPDPVVDHTLTPRYTPTSVTEHDPFSPASDVGECYQCGGPLCSRQYRRDATTSNLCDSCANYSKMNGIRPSATTGIRSPPVRPRITATSGTGNRRTGLNCANCQTNTTTLWRRNNQGEPVCNACGLYFKLHQINRPPSKKNEGIRSRKRKPKNPNSATKEPKKSKTSTSKNTSGYSHNSAKSDGINSYRMDSRIEVDKLLGSSMKLEVGEHNVVLTPQLTHDPILNSVTQDLVLPGRNLDSTVQPINLQLPQQQHRNYMSSLSSLSHHLDPMMSRVSGGAMASHHSIMAANGNHIEAETVGDSGGSVLSEGQMGHTLVETLAEDTVGDTATWEMSSPINAAIARAKQDREKDVVGNSAAWEITSPINAAIGRVKQDREKAMDGDK